MRKLIILFSVFILLAGCSSQKNTKSASEIPKEISPNPTIHQEKLKSTPETGKKLLYDGSRIGIKDRLENVVSKDGTRCTFVFEMAAEQTEGIFKGQAMLESIGVKDVGGAVPAAGMIGIVSKMEFGLSQPQKEVQATSENIDLVSLAKLDYEGSGTFHFIMTDIGFMALQEKVQDDDMVLDIPYKIIVFKDTAVISFKAPDGMYLSFRGEFAPIEDIDLAPLTVK